ncbi:MAG: hypothetical protein IJO99_01470 [Ruminococcus sp.]|nr:hypothetical protein [Ruminococcus sp.]
MQYNVTYTKNLSLLNRCRKIYTVVFYAYAFICVPWVLGSLWGIIFTTGHNELYYFIDGIVIKLAVFFCGLMGCYKHDNLFALLAVGIQMISVVISGSVISGIILTVFIVACVINILTNGKYNWLEQQDGFPYFNERIEQTNENFRSGKDIYKEQYDKLREKNSSLSSEMDEL